MRKIMKSIRNVMYETAIAIIVISVLMSGAIGVWKLNKIIAIIAYIMFAILIVIDYMVNQQQKQ